MLEFFLLKWHISSSQQSPQSLIHRISSWYTSLCVCAVICAEIKYVSKTVKSDLFSLDCWFFEVPNVCSWRVLVNMILILIEHLLDFLDCIYITSWRCLHIWELIDYRPLQFLGCLKFFIPIKFIGNFLSPLKLRSLVGYYLLVKLYSRRMLDHACCKDQRCGEDHSSIVLNYL